MFYSFMLCDYVVLHYSIRYHVMSYHISSAILYYSLCVSLALESLFVSMAMSMSMPMAMAMSMSLAMAMSMLAPSFFLGTQNASGMSWLPLPPLCYIGEPGP